MNTIMFIAIVISLIYFINLALSRFLLDILGKKDESIKDNLSKSWKDDADIINKTQLILCESILTDDIFLFLMLFIYNNKSLDIFKKYYQKFEELLYKIEKKMGIFLSNGIK